MKTKIGLWTLALLALVILGNGCGKFELKEPQISTEALDSSLVIQAAPFACQGGVKASSQSVRRLLKVEYFNTVERMMGGSLLPSMKTAIDVLPEEDLGNGPDSVEHLVDLTQMGKYEQVASQIMSIVRATPTLVSKLGGTCLALVTPTSVCKEAAIKRLGLLAYRRPLTSSELTNLKSVFQLGSNTTESLGFLVYALLLSPDFNFHMPIGDESGLVQDQRISLSSYQIASKLSYLLLSSPPDDELLEAAGRGELKTVVSMNPHIERLPANPRAKVKMQKFLSNWLHYEAFSQDAYSTNFSGGINITALNNEAEREINEFVDHIIWQKRGTLKDLFTSKASFARTRELASVHGHDPVSGETPAQVGNERQGILTRLPFIMSDGDETRPIVRGVKLRTRILCENIGAPSGILLSDSTFFTDEARRQWSTRYRTAELTKDQSCMGCHSRINDLGFVMESFDSLGRYREIERAFDTKGDEIAKYTVDTYVDTLLIGQQTYTAKNSNQLLEHLTTTPQASACFVKQMHRYYAMQMESDADSCMLKSVFDQLTATDEGSIREALKKAIANEWFLHRLPPQ